MCVFDAGLLHIPPGSKDAAVFSPGGDKFREIGPENIQYQKLFFFASQYQKLALLSSVPSYIGHRHPIGNNPETKICVNE